MDAAIYACTYSSPWRSKRAVRPTLHPHFRPPPLSSSSLLPPLDSSNPQRESSHLSPAWTTGLTNLLQLSKIVPTTPRISHVFYLFIKTSSIHQVNGTFCFFFHFPSQNQRGETQQLFPGLAKPGEWLHHLWQASPAQLWPRLFLSFKYPSRSTAHPLWNARRRPARRTRLIAFWSCAAFYLERFARSHASNSPSPEIVISSTYNSTRCQ